MTAAADLIRRTLPQARVKERRGELELHFPLGTTTRFRILPQSDDLDAPLEPSVVMIEHANPRLLESLRQKGISFVTIHGHVFLRAPGVYVDVRPARSVSDPDRARNPFSHMGRQVCVRLLLDPGRAWAISELAHSSSVSQSYVSRIVTGLEDQGLVEASETGLRPYPDLLFAALTEHWPKPSAYYLGRVPRRGEAPIGGGPAYKKFGLAVPAIPRAYVANRERLRHLVVRTGSTPTASRAAEWEAVVQPLPVRNVLVPAVICALELARDPRGREVLRTHRIVDWDIYG